MAREMGATPHQVGWWLSGEHFPGPESRAAVAAYLDVPVEQLDALDPKPAVKGRPRRSQKQELELLRAQVGRLAAVVAGLSEEVRALREER